jgi:hypothetical protein
LRKNLSNSPKFYLANVSMIVNLDGLNSVQKFEYITQVANKLDLIIKELNLNTNFEPGLYYSYIVIAL